MKKVILSMISTAVVSGFGIYCLLNGLLEGAESVVLILGGVFVGFIVYFSSEIQEFTIAGNAVKFKDLKNEAKVPAISFFTLNFFVTPFAISSRLSLTLSLKSLPRNC